MKKIRLTFCLFLLCLGIGNYSFAQNEQWGLSVSPDGHFLQQKDGQPFFWMGSTSWVLHQNLSREDVLFFLDDAKEKHLNVIHLMTANKWALNDYKNYFGDTPYIDKDATRLNLPYWNHLGWVIDQAAERGFYVFLVYGSPGRKDEGMPFVNTPAEAYSYGNAIGLFFKDKPNIIWAGGIDVNPDDTTRISEMGIEGWHAMAEGVADGVNSITRFDNSADYSSTLMTYHPKGFNSSSRWFHTAPWLDFNGVQIGLGKNRAWVYWTMSTDYDRTPTKPTVIFEPWYEHNSWRKDTVVNDWEVRIQCYQSIFTGAFGFTYGHMNIYPFNSPEYVHTVGSTWKELLDAPGRVQMKHARTLMESAKLSYWIPAPGIITSSENDSHRSLFLQTRISGISHLERNYVLIYSPQGESFSVNLSTLIGQKIAAWWFDPRTGKSQEIGEFATTGEQEFDPPGLKEEGNDWILVLESI